MVLQESEGEGVLGDLQTQRRMLLLVNVDAVEM